MKSITLAQYADCILAIFYVTEHKVTTYNVESNVKPKCENESYRV